MYNNNIRKKLKGALILIPFESNRQNWKIKIDSRKTTENCLFQCRSAEGNVQDFPVVLFYIPQKLPQPTPLSLLPADDHRAGHSVECWGARGGSNNDETAFIPKIKAPPV
jgi:hypothetical protein